MHHNLGTQNIYIKYMIYIWLKYCYESQTDIKYTNIVILVISYAIIVKKYSKNCLLFHYPEIIDQLVHVHACVIIAKGTVEFLICNGNHNCRYLCI